MTRSKWTFRALLVLGVLCVLIALSVPVQNGERSAAGKEPIGGAAVVFYAVLGVAALVAAYVVNRRRRNKED